MVSKLYETLLPTANQLAERNRISLRVCNKNLVFLCEKVIGPPRYCHPL